MPVTRREFLRAGWGGAAGLLLSGLTASGQALAAQRPASMVFRSRPDLRPPTVSLTTAGPQSGEEGYLFLGPTSKNGAQAGPMIVDAGGQLIWFQPLPKGRWATNFRVQSYENQTVLAWWQGAVDPVAGYGRGAGVILDGSYRQIGLVRAGNGRHADLHELLLTAEGTALLTCYPDVVPADLSGIGGPRRGHVLQSVIQEVDLATGRVRFEWRSLEHIGLAESYYPVGSPYDYLHINSIDVTPDGHLLVSARHTWALYKLHRRTGRVLWRLGGKRSDFAMGRGTRFAWQHDARAHRGGQISLFDDGAGARETEPQSRGVVLQVDHRRRTVQLARSYRHPQPLLAYAMGNLQLLPDGNAIVGWGNLPWLTEFAAGGSMLMDLRLPWGHDSYRVFRFPWSASPSDTPALAAASTGGASTLYASWNGATGVSAWQVSTGPSPSALTPAGVVPRSGFETVIPLSLSTGYAAVTAVGGDGQALGTSHPVQL